MFLMLLYLRVYMQAQNIQLVFVRSHMSFSNLSQHQRVQETYLNPMNKINKGFRKANKPFPLTTISKRVTTQQTEQQPKLSFSSLSKRPSQCSLNSNVRNVADSSSSKNKYFCGAESKYDSCRKRLTYESSTSRDASKENKMNFSNIIRKSKEKSLKRSSLMAKSPKKVIQPPVPNKNHPFNKLKNKLIGQQYLNEPILPASPSKRARITPPQELDVVRVSMQSSVAVNELDMSPCL